MINVCSVKGNLANYRAFRAMNKKCANWFQRELKNIADKMYTDAMGNLIAVKKRQKAIAKK